MIKNLVVIAISAFSFASSAAGSTIYNFQIDTSTLIAAKGPFALDLFFIDGGNSTNNSAIVTITGGGTATLQDTFFTEQQLAFAVTPLLRFQLVITTNPDLGTALSPDSFYAALLQNGNQVTTTDPTGGNALISVTLPTVNGGAPFVQFNDTANNTFRPGFLSQSAASEPATAALGSLALVMLLAVRRYRPLSL